MRKLMNILQTKKHKYCHSMSQEKDHNQSILQFYDMYDKTIAATTCFWI